MARPSSKSNRVNQKAVDLSTELHQQRRHYTMNATTSQVSTELQAQNTSTTNIITSLLAVCQAFASPFIIITSSRLHQLAKSSSANKQYLNNCSIEYLVYYNV